MKHLHSRDLPFFFFTFPRFHLLPHLVVDDSWTGRGLDHHAGHTAQSGQPRSAKDVAKTPQKTVAVCVVVSRPLCGRVNCGNYRAAAGPGRRRIHWQAAASDPRTKNWFSFQPQDFKTNATLAISRLNSTFKLTQLDIKERWYHVHQNSEQAKIWYAMVGSSPVLDIRLGGLPR